MYQGLIETVAVSTVKLSVQVLEPTFFIPKSGTGVVQTDCGVGKAFFR